jgi:hypothetical protein
MLTGCIATALCEIQRRPCAIGKIKTATRAVFIASRIDESRWRLSTSRFEFVDENYIVNDACLAFVRTDIRTGSKRAWKSISARIVCQVQFVVAHVNCRTSRQQRDTEYQATIVGQWRKLRTTAQGSQWHTDVCSGYEIVRTGNGNA